MTGVILQTSYVNDHVLFIFYAKKKPIRKAP